MGKLTFKGFVPKDDPLFTQGAYMFTRPEMTRKANESEDAIVPSDSAEGGKRYKTGGVGMESVTEKAMSGEHTDQQTLEEHIAARNGVISEYEHLWRQAIGRSGFTDEKAVSELLQVCAACYLDGVRQGSLLTIEQIATGK